jgi:hypothetical protein
MVFPHFNVGYTWAGSGVAITNAGTHGSLQYSADFVTELSDQIDYAAGADVALLDRLTVSGDLLGRVLRHAAEFRQVRFVTDDGTEQAQPFLFEKNLLHAAVAVFGAKYRIAPGWLLNGNVLFSVGLSGVKPGVTPVIGLERATTRSARTNTQRRK